MPPGGGGGGGGARCGAGARLTVCQKDMDVRISEDAGHYLCDFIYYSSLSTLLTQGRPRKAVFLHVPCDASDRYIAQGRAVALGLIRSIADSEAAARRRARDEPPPA